MTRMNVLRSLLWAGHITIYFNLVRIIIQSAVCQQMITLISL